MRNLAGIVIPESKPDGELIRDPSIRRTEKCKADQQTCRVVSKVTPRLLARHASVQQKRNGSRLARPSGRLAGMTTQGLNWPMTENTETSQNILVIKHGALGDVMLATAPFKAIANTIRAIASR